MTLKMIILFVLALILLISVSLGYSCRHEITPISIVLCGHDLGNDTIIHLGGITPDVFDQIRMLKTFSYNSWSG